MINSDLGLRGRMENFFSYNRRYYTYKIIGKDGQKAGTKRGEDFEKFVESLVGKKI